MVCKQCGAYCEQNRSFCPVCRAPLPIEELDTGDATPARQAPSSEQSEQSPPPSGWGFVQPPSWPKPTFDLDAVDEIPIPEPAASVDTQGAQTVAQPFYTAPDKPGQYREQPLSQPTQDAWNKGPYSAPITPRSSVSRQPGMRANMQYPAAQAEGEAYDTNEGEAQYQGKPIPSVGDYEGNASYNTGSFGRIPQRAEANEHEEDFPSRNVRKSPRGALPGRRSPSRHLRMGAYRSSTGRRNNLLFFGAAGALVVLLIVFSVILLNKKYGGVGGFFSSVFGGSPVLKPVETGEGIGESGDEVWEIMLYAKAGLEVTMRVGEQETSGIIGEKNEKQLRIPKSLLLPTTPVDGATAEVAPEVFLTTADGEIVPVDIPPFTVQVPALTVQITNPQGSSAAVNRSKLTFSGQVNDGGVAVTVQNQPMTVNPDGTFSGDYELGEPGNHTITLEAKKAGYQIFRQTFQIEYTQSEQFYVDVEKTSLRATDNTDSIIVKGSIGAGATMKVNCSNSNVTLGTPEVDASGSFTLSVKMAEIGSYTIEAEITKDGAASTGIIIVERPPALQAYSASVHKMDRDRMMKEPNHDGQYKCIGTVTEVLQTDPFIIAKLQTSDGDILFEYHNVAAKVEVGDGKTYNVFGDYVGLDETTGLPIVYGWFIIKE